MRIEELMNRKDVRAQIQNIGIIASIRVPSSEDARFAAETLAQAGIPIAEISASIPNAGRVICDIARNSPQMIVGAGSLLDEDAARRFVDAGAKFLTTDGLIPEIVEFAVSEDIVVFPGALTPTEIIAAWPTTVTRSLCPRALARRTQKPFSVL